MNNHFDKLIQIMSETRYFAKTTLLFIPMVAVSLWAVEVRMTGYEPQDPLVEVSGSDSEVTAEIVKGADAGTPFCLDGEHVLKVSWKQMPTRSVSVKHLFKEKEFDLRGYQRLLLDIYIPDSVKPKDVKLFEETLGELKAVNRIETNQWITFEFDISKKQVASLKEISKFTFHNIPQSSGVIYIDNLRLLNFVPEIEEIRGEEKRIDLSWKPLPVKDLRGYVVYRAPKGTDSFEIISPSGYELSVYSDFIGKNDVEYTYRVSSVVNWKEFPKSDPATAASKALTDDQLLTSIQRACFRYFWNQAHPVSGASFEGYPHRKDVCAAGGTGMGIFNILIASEREFISREHASRHILKLLAFLEDKAVRHHGAWPHWFDGLTGQTIPFGRHDDGGDIVETAYLIEGILAARQYFNNDNVIENDIRQRATRLWEEVEWDWYRRYPDSPYIYWHWSPNYEWSKNHPVRGFNECMILYILAVASPTHSVPPSCYHDGWAQGGNTKYRNNKEFYGHRLHVGPDYGGPLFFTHYSYLGFDPRDKQDAYCNYFENNRTISLIHQAYCIDNPYQYEGYGKQCWGLTSSTTPAHHYRYSRGRSYTYKGHRPHSSDNGTITPTAAVSAMPYVPEASMLALKYFYHELGDKLWGAFGFYDAFNLSRNPDWYSSTWLAIDQGTIAPMIENFRTQLCWDLFMKNPEIQPALEAIGFKKSPSNAHSVNKNEEQKK